MAKDLFDTVRTSQNRLAGRGRIKENYACKGCFYLNEERGRCRRRGGRCGPDDQSCVFYIIPERYYSKITAAKRMAARIRAEKLKERGL